jgi:3-phenylpropionate/trans-cinnamate dioxygenase ferredoxin subunit
VDYIRLARVSDIADGALSVFEMPAPAGDRICVVSVEGALHAFADACPHAACPLSEGTLSGRILTCHCHGSEFDVISGEILAEPAEEPLLLYPLRITDGFVEVATEL